jgi:hypothetical protein
MQMREMCHVQIVWKELLQGVLAKKNMLLVPTKNQCKVAAARVER